jgi:hypothetical protein
MISNGWQAGGIPDEVVFSNCFACGRSMEQVRTMPLHAPDPSSDLDRCTSRPPKYDHLRCVYAAGHECAHTARVAGTGRHFWLDADGASN